MAISVRVSSVLNVSAAELWEAVTRMDGVNYELAPYLKMSYPKEAKHLSLADAETDRVLFTSTLLIGGLIPYDRHKLRLKEIGPGMRFAEDSTSLTMEYWRHTREVIPQGDKSALITDNIECKPRLWGEFLIEAIIKEVFGHRHSRLREKFGP